MSKAKPTIRVKLSTKYVENIQPPAEGREVHYDTKVTGLGVSVTANGARTWVLYTRYPTPDGPRPARRALGAAPRKNVVVTGQLTLEEARAKAEAWHKLIANGVDPLEDERRQQEEARLARNATFGAVAEEFIKRRLPRQRRGFAVASDLRRNAIPRWEDRPIAEITRKDVAALVEDLSDRPAQAHNTLANLKVLFNWLIARGTYGVEHSPCDRLKPAQLIGPKVFRDRVLEDDELRAVWTAAGQEGYPFGSIVQFLLLTGMRRSEASEARWREFHPEFVKLLRKRGETDQPIDWRKVDDEIKLLTIPSERFKSGASHLVPLSDAACRLLEGLPRFKHGDHLFSTSGGAKPVSGFTVPKRRIDRLIHAQLGEGRAGWVLHDLRRTVRTRLSGLRVPDAVAEMVVGHAKKGLQRVYDQHSYQAEMREALMLWAARLDAIVNPREGSNVVALRAEAG